MVFVGIVHNIALLIVLSVVSGYLTQRLRFRKYLSTVLGFVYGLVAVVGIMHPMQMQPGLIFDGRTVVISLCGLFFGPWAVTISAAIAAGYRLTLGGEGIYTGVSTILSAGAIGAVLHYAWVRKNVTLGPRHFAILGILVHIAMLIFMALLPAGTRLSVLQRIWFPIITLYPVATVLIGKVLSDQESRSRFIEELAQSQQKFEAIANYTVDMESWFDNEGKYYWVNPASQRFTGYSPEQILAMPDPVSVLVYPEDRKPLKSAFGDVLRGNAAGEYEFRLQKKDGSIMWVSNSWRRIYDSEGNSQGVRVSTHDITERKKSEEALLHSEEKFAKAFHLSPDAININRLSDGAYMDVNQGFTLLSGYTREEVVGCSTFSDDLGIWVDTEDRDRLLQHIKEHGEITDFEAHFHRKDGTEVIGLVSARVIVLDGEECLLSIARDVTELRNTEEEKRKFYRNTIKSVTQGKLDLPTSEEISEYLDSSVHTFGVQSVKDISAARRLIAEHMTGLGLREEKVYSMEIATGEAITNAIKHAPDCKVYIGRREDVIWVGVEDKGPGISSSILPDATLRKGFSSKVSMGLGYTIMMEEADNVLLRTDSEGTTVILLADKNCAVRNISLKDLPDTWDEVQTPGL